MNQENDTKARRMRKAFIDASNVIRHTENIKEGGEPKLKNLKLAIEEVEERGYEPEPIGDASLWYVFGGLGDLPLGLMDELNSCAITAKGISPDFKEAVKSLRKIKEKARDIELAVKQHAGVDVSADVMPPRGVIVWADPKDTGRVIGKNGQNVKRLEDEFGFKIVVKESGEKSLKAPFEPGERAFDEVAKKVRESGLELSENAEVYAWRTFGEKERWIILDGDREYEVNRWEDWSQDGRMRLSIHDRMEDEHLEFCEMVKRGDLRVEPTRREADEYILGFAEKFPNSIIISNDQYREYEDEYPFVRDRERRLDFDIVSDKILIAGLEDAEVPTPSRAPLEVKEPPLKAPPRVREGEMRVEKEKTRVLKTVGTTLACLGLLSLVFLPLAGLLNEASFFTAVGASLMGWLLRLAGRESRRG